MRTHVSLVVASIATAACLSAQAPQIGFAGDFRIGRTAMLQTHLPGATGFLDVIGLGQLQTAVAIPFGTVHLDPQQSIWSFVLATAGTAVVPVPLPATTSIVGVRVFGQALGVPGTFSGVADFVVGGLFEDLTERNAADWSFAVDDYTTTTTLSDDPNGVVGQTAVRLDTGSGAMVFAYFPATRNAGWDASANAQFEFRIRADNANPYLFQGNQPVVRLGTGTQSWFEYTPDRDLLSPVANSGTWLHVRVPLAGGATWSRQTRGAPSLQQIDWIAIGTDTWGSGFTARLDGVAFTPFGVARPFAPAAAEADVDVTFVERFPRYLRYDVVYDPVTGVPSLAPGTGSEKRWPDPNEQVTFRGHYKNAGSRHTGPLRLEWYVDGLLQSTGLQPGLAPGAAATSDYGWGWQNGRHVVRFVVWPEDGRRQVALRNDEIEFATDALTFGFSIEQSCYAQLEAMPNLFGSRSAEDWLNGHLAWMNEMFAISTYPPWAPQGATQRVRIDKVTIVPDGTWHWPWPVDREVDGQWGFPIASIAEYANHKAVFDWALMHELSHQIGLVDLYQMNLEPQQNLVNGRGFGQTNPGLMAGGTVEGHSGGTFYASADVFGLNVTQGHRRGFYGDYLFAVPASCAIAVTEGGQPLANTAVRLYQKDKWTGLVDATPEIVGTTDALGRLVLPNRPVVGVTTATGLTLADNPWGQIDVVGVNGLFLVEAATANGLRWGWLCLWQANVEWARGNRAACLLPVAVAL